MTINDIVCRIGKEGMRMRMQRWESKMYARHTGMLHEGVEYECECECECEMQLKKMETRSFARIIVQGVVVTTRP